MKLIDVVLHESLSARLHGMNGGDVHGTSRVLGIKAFQFIVPFSVPPSYLYGASKPYHSASFLVAAYDELLAPNYHAKSIPTPLGKVLSAKNYHQRTKKSVPSAIL
jgi:hypothetical protein